MSKFEFDLVDGLKLGEDTLKHVTLRNVIAGDIIEASEESEKLVFANTGNGQTEPMLISSPALMGSNVLRRQVVKIGNFQGPLEMAQLKSLSAEDLALLQEKADLLEAASTAKAASKAVTQVGRTDNSSE